MYMIVFIIVLYYTSHRMTHYVYLNSLALYQFNNILIDNIITSRLVLHHSVSYMYKYVLER